MSVVEECPICYEIVCNDANYVITSCKHTFHSDCLLKHVACNDFTCPYCRTKFIEDSFFEPDSESDYDEDDESYDSYEDDIHPEIMSVSESEILETFRLFHQRVNGEQLEIEQDEILQTFRWFHQRINGSELEDTREQTAAQIDEENNIIYQENKDQANILIKRIKDINKLSYENLLAAFIYTNCKDYKYNTYAEKICYDVTSMINDVHDRLEY